MSKAVQRRFGTTAEHADFTGISGEFTYNTDTKAIHTHDGVTAGGYSGGGYLDSTASNSSPIGVAKHIGHVYTPAQWGCVGDGVTNDATALEAALEGVPTGGVLDGGGKTYYLGGRVTATLTHCHMRNFRFVLPTVYTTDTGITLVPTGGTTAAAYVTLENIYVDGGRSTYKTGSERWTVFTSLLGYDSIEPTLSALFQCTSWNASSRFTVSNFVAVNVHAESVVQIKTYGYAQLSQLYFKNCSNKTWHVYHSDDAITQAGSTHCDTVVCLSCGILPSTFLVDGVSTTHAGSTAMPQGAFGCIVTCGSFHLTNAYVDGWGSTAVTADRNISFVCSNITIKNSTSSAMSNNPSGAFWLEDCRSALCSDIYIETTARDSRELALGSSSIQLFCTADSTTKLRNIRIRSTVGSAKVYKHIRGSVHSSADISISGLDCVGTTSASNSVDFGHLPDSAIAYKVTMTDCYVATGDINFDSWKTLYISDCNFGGSLRAGPSGNSGITGSLGDIGVANSNMYSIALTGTQAGHVRLSNVRFGTDIDLGSGTAEYMLNGCCVNGQCTITSGAYALLTNCNILRRLHLRDVGGFSVCGNVLHTNAAEPVIHINPVTAANVLGGSIVGNLRMIYTGVMGAGYELIAGGTGTITSANNTDVVASYSNT